MWVGLSQTIDAAAIEAALRQLLMPKAVVFTDYPEDDWPEATVTLSTNESEFPLTLDFWALSSDDDTVQTECFKIARLLATHFGCRTICDGSGYGDDESPYWSIIWDSDGRSYLADDHCTMFGDGVGGPVQIVREIRLSKDMSEAMFGPKPGPQ